MIGMPIAMLTNAAAPSANEPAQPGPGPIQVQVRLSSCMPRIGLAESERTRTRYYALFKFSQPAALTLLGVSCY